MDVRTRVCFALSRRLIRRPPSTRTVDYGHYETWRTETLSHAWGTFPDEAVNGKDVLDFGCGGGQLALFLATDKRPKSIVGVDINDKFIARARSKLEITNVTSDVTVEFFVGSRMRCPLEIGPSILYWLSIVWSTLCRQDRSCAIGTGFYGLAENVLSIGPRLRVLGDPI